MNPEEKAATEKSVMHLTVNQKPYDLTVGLTRGAVSPTDTLAQTLRETLGLTGTKIGCDQGSCGSCTVLMNGNPILSCMTLTIECDGAHIITIEGLEDRETGRLHPLQQSFIDHTAFQCGFCTPGILMSARALLDRDPDPGVEAVKESLSGHYCRCISHYEVVDAVLDAAEKAKHD